MISSTSRPYSLKKSQKLMPLKSKKMLNGKKKLKLTILKPLSSKKLKISLLVDYNLLSYRPTPKHLYSLKLPNISVLPRKFTSREKELPQSSESLPKLPTLRMSKLPNQESKESLIFATNSSLKSLNLELLRKLIMIIG